MLPTQIIGNIVVCRNAKTKGFKVIRARLCWSKVNQAATGKKHEGVKHFEYI